MSENLMERIITSEEQDVFTLQLPLNHPITAQVKRILVCFDALSRIDQMGYKRPSLFSSFGFKQVQPNCFLEKTLAYIESTLLTEVSNVMMIHSPMNGVTFLALAIAKQALSQYETLYLQSPTATR